MRMVALLCLLICSGCGVAPQPDSIRTVAAYEIPLPTESDRAAFLAILRRNAEAGGFHLDAASAEELRILSRVSPLTLNATVWLGEDDDEVVVSAMDHADHLGRIWLSFSKGENPPRFVAFRNSLMVELRRTWPDIAPLPIMPTGAIPLPDDLVRTAAGYQVKPSARSKYQIPAQERVATRD